MHVEEHGTVALLEGAAIQAAELAMDRFEDPARDVARNDRVGHAGQPTMPQVHVRAAHFGTLCPKKGGTRREFRRIELANLNRLARSHHDSRTNATTHSRTLPLVVRSRISFLFALQLAVAASAAAQSSGTPGRPHFVTVSYDWHYTQSLHFAKFPLEDFLGVDVASTQANAYEYRTRDDTTLIDVLEFSHRQQGLTATIYPLGMNVGPTLALRGSIEPLPQIRLAFVGPAPFGSYSLTDTRSFDASIGVYVADRSPGWGLGSHAFAFGGIGKITGNPGGGRRYFAEGGGGVSSGPFGVDLSVKFAWNRLVEPMEHRFLTVPITLRGTLTF